MAHDVICRFFRIGDINKFREVALDDRKRLDFSILVPMPSTLDLYDSLGRFPLDLEYPEVDTHLDTYLQACVARGIRISHALKNWNTALYGYPSWRDWREAKWGTKTNPLTVVIDSELPVFRTSWDPPKVWLQELWMHTDFVMGYASADNPCLYQGIIVAAGQNMEEYDLDSYEERRVVEYWVRYVELAETKFLEDMVLPGFDASDFKATLADLKSNCLIEDEND